SNRTLAVASLTQAEQNLVSGTPTANDTDTIAFNIPGAGVHTISPLYPLPEITDSAVIDGYTQPGASPNTNGPGLPDNAVLQIEISGASGGLIGLQLEASDTTVRGLVLNRFSQGAIGITRSNNKVQGNFIGTDPSGTSILLNRIYGVLVTAAANSLIGGSDPADRNLIAGSSGAGIILSGIGGPTVQGTTI